MDNTEVLNGIKLDINSLLMDKGIHVVGFPELEIRHACFLIIYKLSNDQVLYVKVFKYKDIIGKSLYESTVGKDAREMGCREYQSYCWFLENIKTADLSVYTLPVLTYLERWNAIVSFKIDAEDLFYSLRQSNSTDELYRIGRWLRRVHQTMDTESKLVQSPDEFCHNLYEGLVDRLKSSFTPIQLTYSTGLSDFDCRDILINKHQLYCLDLCTTEKPEPQLHTVGRFAAGIELLYWGTKYFTLKEVPRTLIESFLKGYFESYSHDDVQIAQRVVNWFTIQSLLRHSWQVSNLGSKFHKIYNFFIGRPYLKKILNNYYFSAL